MGKAKPRRIPFTVHITADVEETLPVLLHAQKILEKELRIHFGALDPAVYVKTVDVEVWDESDL